MTPEEQSALGAYQKCAAERDAMSEQLEVDRTAVADCMTKVKKELNSRAWMATGRGSYEWDDDKYQQEFGTALEAIGTALDPLTKIAADWTGCPKTSAEIAQARIELKQERDALKLELESSRQAERTTADQRDRFKLWANCGGVLSGRTCSVDGHKIYGSYFTDANGDAATCEMHQYQNRIDSLLRLCEEMRDALKSIMCAECRNRVLFLGSLLLDLNREDEPQPCPNCKLKTAAIRRANEVLGEVRG